MPASGKWLTADLPDGEATATANFEVVARATSPTSVTTHHEATSCPVTPTHRWDAIDSRAEPDGTVPDPILYRDRGPGHRRGRP